MQQSCAQQTAGGESHQMGNCGIEAAPVARKGKQTDEREQAEPGDARERYGPKFDWIGQTEALKTNLPVYRAGLPQRRAQTQ